MRAQDRNRFPLVAAINSKILLAGRYDRVLRVKLTHSDDTQIRQVRPLVLVPLGKLRQPGRIFGDVEFHLQHLIDYQGQHVR